MPRLAQLLARSRHRAVREYTQHPDPEHQWLHCPVLGWFGSKPFVGKVARIDRQVQDGKRTLPLQLLVQYEDGDQAHLDEDEVARQAKAYCACCHTETGCYVAPVPQLQSQSRHFAQLSMGLPPAKRQRRQPQRFQLGVAGAARAWAEH